MPLFRAIEKGKGSRSKLPLFYFQRGWTGTPKVTETLRTWVVIVKGLRTDLLPLIAQHFLKLLEILQMLLQTVLQRFYFLEFAVSLGGLILDFQ